MFLEVFDYAYKNTVLYLRWLAKVALSFLSSLLKVTHETFTHVQSSFQVETKKVLNAEAKFQLLQKITDLKCSTKESTNVLQNGLQQRCFPISLKAQKQLPWKIL